MCRLVVDQEMSVRLLPRVLLFTAAALIVLTALLISGLRLLMPLMNDHRAVLLETLSHTVGVTVSAGELQGQWETFGPNIEAKNVQITLSNESALSIGRITMALDIWQSLLHFRWQFRDLVFYQFSLNTSTPLTDSPQQENTFTSSQLSDLFLRQFDHFDLRDSTIRFVTLSGQHAELAIPHLTWLNEHNRHRAEGSVSLSSLTGQHGAIQVRLDLRDSAGLLDSGRIWLQADDIDVRPWLGQWMRDNSSLNSAHFSLAAWAGLKNGRINEGDLWLKQGGADWLGEGESHHLGVENVMAHLNKADGGWVVNVPQTGISTDNQPWPAGHFALFWRPEQSDKGASSRAELRVRATQVDLQRLTPLLPLSPHFSPQWLDKWRALQPSGQLQRVAADIPLSEPDKARFQLEWQDISWQPWQTLPGGEHLSGRLAGSMAEGQLQLGMHNALLNWSSLFKAPLEISQASGRVTWQRNEQQLIFVGDHLDIQARALRASGDFSFHQQQGQAPLLSILAGITITHAGELWRYFPEPFMGTDLTHYLSRAIQGGRVDNATLLFRGDPDHFPFRHGEGQFEVWVPLRQSTYAFQPDWPAMDPLDIDLDFVNGGLSMAAPQVAMGQVQASGLRAEIPDYKQQMLIIDGDIAGSGTAISHYFNQTPLKASLGKALDALQPEGLIGGHLNLTIPLNGGRVVACGQVNLNDNTLHIAPLGTTLSHLSGGFKFSNGDLQSEVLRGQWLGQPVDIDFTTRTLAKNYQIEVNLAGDWQPAKLPGIPASVGRQVRGAFPWQGQVHIDLPDNGGEYYEVQLQGDLKNVSSRLPAPLSKSAGSPLPVNMVAKGDQRQMQLSGVAHQQRFNSHWSFGRNIRLEQGVWGNGSGTLPSLPAGRGLTLNLPAIDGEAWLGLLSQGKLSSSSNNVRLASDVTVRSPLVSLAGQQWHALSATLSSPHASVVQATIRGREIEGTLTIPASGPWRGHLDYLYYNPQWDRSPAGNTSMLTDATSGGFDGWPSLQLICEKCWIRGQNVGRLQGNLSPGQSRLALNDGRMDLDDVHLSLEGEWINRPGEQRTALRGQLSGDNTTRAAHWFGVNSLLYGAAFRFDYDLQWLGAPWQMAENSLSGSLKTHLDKGKIMDVDTGNAGRLLRLVSFDALLRKLRFDFSDTFAKGFYFDSINGMASIKEGVMHTDNLLVDGLEADIAMKGDIDLVKRQIDIEAVIAPEISTPVGVATAFVINPVVGAAVFAASKVLTPLWNKISMLRYHIHGPIDKPDIDEVLRKPRE